MKPVVVLISDGSEEHCLRVGRELRRRGVEPFELDQQNLSATSVRLTLGGPSSCEGSLESAEGRSIRIKEITAVAYWPTWIQANVPGMSAEARLLVEDEWYAFLANLAFLTPQARWVNPWWVRTAGHPRLHQLRLAQSLGLAIPETLVTNSIDEVREFVGRFPSGAANKRLTNLLRPLPGHVVPSTRILTTRIDPVKLAEADPNSVRYAPVYLQEYVPKDVEIRAYVAGDSVLSVEILSQEDPQTADDWRNYPVAQTADGPDLDIRRWKCRITELPAHLNRAIIELTRQLGLYFSGVDLIRRPDGKYVFLEANYGGAWAWIQDITGLPVLERYTDLLVSEGIPILRAEPPSTVTDRKP